uniref:Glycosyltransferase 8 domain-containing protein 1 n=1 Tax=Hucho hucho TaxID=62062 RepID=A0A4W5MFZ3_9TELE
MFSSFLLPALYFSVNVVILVLLPVAFLIIVQWNLLNLNDFLRREINVPLCTVPGMILPYESEFSPELKPDPVRTGEEIPVIITAVEERLGAVVAAMNSVYQNNKANIVFNIVTMNDTVDDEVWMSKTQLNNVKHKIIIFEPKLLNGKITNQLTIARFYMPVFIPDAENEIYLDDDNIVQGDIQELFDASVKSGHAAALSDDSDSASTKDIVRGAGNQVHNTRPTCSFNPGVIVANLTEWKHHNITSQLEHWMELNAQQLKSIPFEFICFYCIHFSIDHVWHIRHLGATGAGNRYSPQFVKAAKLLSWNGHYKPWSRTSSFTEVWDKRYIHPVHPVQKHTGDK